MRAIYASCAGTAAHRHNNRIIYVCLYLDLYALVVYLLCKRFLALDLTIQRCVKWLFHIAKVLCLFVWFLTSHQQSLVIKGRVFLGCTSTKLGLMFLLNDTTQWRWWGSNPQPLGLESSTLPLSHCAPTNVLIILIETWKLQHSSYPNSKEILSTSSHESGPGRVLGEPYTGCVLNVTEYWWSVFCCSLLLTCSETGESRFLSPLHVNTGRPTPSSQHYWKIVDWVENFLHVQEGPKVHPAGWIFGPLADVRIWEA